MLSEEAVRKNCVLVYELLDEVIDNGFPQSTSSEALKEYVLNVPIIVKSVRHPCSRVHSIHQWAGSQFSRLNMADQARDVSMRLSTSARPRSVAGRRNVLRTDEVGTQWLLCASDLQLTYLT